jgi:carotenoid cleavage dioxygenase-like enzyme
MHMPLATDDFYVMLESNCYYPDAVTNVGEVDWKGWKTDPRATSHVRLVNRSSGESLLYPLKSNVFGIHHINAFYDKSSNSVVADTIQIFPSFVPCNTAFKQTDLQHFSRGSWFSGLGFSMSKLVRLTLPVDRPGADVEPHELTRVHGLEFPTIRYDDFNGKPYQFVYANYISHYRSAYYDSLIKVDVNTGAYLVWTEEGAYPGEPIFVPNPEGNKEDDGVVMTNVLDTKHKETYLLILDAKTMKEVARAGPTPHVIPHGFHGRYFDRKLNAPSPRSVWV